MHILLFNLMPWQRAELPIGVGMNLMNVHMARQRIEQEAMKRAAR